MYVIDSFDRKRIVESGSELDMILEVRWEGWSLWGALLPWYGVGLGCRALDVILEVRSWWAEWLHIVAHHCGWHTGHMGEELELELVPWKGWWADMVL